MLLTPKASLQLDAAPARVEAARRRRSLVSTKQGALWYFHADAAHDDEFGDEAELSSFCPYAFACELRPPSLSAQLFIGVVHGTRRRADDDARRRRGGIPDEFQADAGA